eukprot:TRINITY_DN14931_c0_g1_i1.p1 TRINITY_DN14931_c0_g1~~TRINITY_DN14931_c0_g1_i1.p1  ORF type:complete len:137 (-),score=38.59 TRINITY_DN14931_c0_g1_i1:66-476(-)
MLSRLKEITFKDNPVCLLRLYRPYAIFLLGSNVNTLDGDLIGTLERDEAHGQFSGLRAGLRKAESRQFVRHVYTSTAEKLFAKTYVDGIVNHAVSIDEKIRNLNTIWPQVMDLYIREALESMEEDGQDEEEEEEMI